MFHIARQILDFFFQQKTFLFSDFVFYFFLFFPDNFFFFFLLQMGFYFFYDLIFKYSKFIIIISFLIAENQMQHKNLYTSNTIHIFVELIFGFLKKKYKIKKKNSLTLSLRIGITCSQVSACTITKSKLKINI